MKQALAYVIPSEPQTGNPSTGGHLCVQLQLKRLPTSRQVEPNLQDSGPQGPANVWDKDSEHNKDTFYDY